MNVSATLHVNGRPGHPLQLSPGESQLAEQADTELYRKEKREEGDRGGQEDKRGESKGEREIQPIISSLSVLHRLEHTEIHRVG